MFILESIPAVIRACIVFAAILFAIRKKLSLGNAFLLGALLLSLLFTMPALNLLAAAGKAVIYPKTLSLALIVSLILILSNSMEQTGQMQRMLEAFKGLIASPRLNLIVFPALIGLLPMPGGAVFSAPMVKQLGDSSNLSGSQLSFTNYWFRHIWEYWWPLYPGILLATVLADVNLALLVAIMSPLTLIAISFGYTILKRASTDVPHARSPSSHRSARRFWIELLPILIVIIPGLLMGLFLSQVIPAITVGKELGLILALFLAIGWVARKNHETVSRLVKRSARPELLKMVYMIFAILVFKEILEDSGAVEMISEELITMNIPIFLITIALPFLVGIITGITVAFVGSTFPILIPLIHSLDPAASLVPYIMLALTCGFAGVLISPLHLCLILSNEYFSADMKSVYRQLWLPCGGLVMVSCLYFFALQPFFGA
jgi:hypothetical protein